MTTKYVAQFLQKTGEWTDITDPCETKTAACIASGCLPASRVRIVQVAVEEEWLCDRKKLIGLESENAELKKRLLAFKNGQEDMANAIFRLLASFKLVAIDDKTIVDAKAFSENMPDADDTNSGYAS